MSLSRLIKMREGLERFQEKIIPTIRQVLWDNEYIIIDMNATDQLFDKGIDSKGISINTYAPYAEYTIQIKKQKGQPYDRVTLHDEGEFAESFFLDVGADSFEIKAADGKTQELLRSYGRDVMGLTNENLREIIKVYIYPELIKVRDIEIYGTNS